MPSQTKLPLILPYPTWAALAVAPLAAGEEELLNVALMPILHGLALGAAARTAVAHLHTKKAVPTVADAAKAPYGRYLPTEAEATLASVELLGHVGRWMEGRLAGRRLGSVRPGGGREPIPVGLGLAPLQEWAKGRKALSLLEARAFNVASSPRMRFELALERFSTVGEALGASSAQFRGITTASFNRTRNACVEWTQQWLDADTQAQQERGKTLATAPPDPILREIIDALSARREIIAAQALSRPTADRRAVGIGVESDPTSLSIRGEVPTTCWGRDTLLVPLRVEQLRGFTCDCGREPGCERLLFALDVALDVLATDTHTQLREQACAELRTPWWQPVWKALAASPAPSDLEEGDLAWRIDIGPWEWKLVPSLARPKKTGRGWVLKAMDARLLLADASRITHRTDREVLETLAAAQRNNRALSSTEIWLLLERLSGHPRIFLKGETGTPAVLRSGAATLRAEANGDDIGLGIVGPCGPIPWESANAVVGSGGEGPVALVRGDQGTLEILRFSPALRRLVGALNRRPRVFPRDAVPELLERLTNDLPDTPVVFDDALRGETVQGDPTPVLRLELVGDGLVATAWVRPAPGLRECRPGEGIPSHLMMTDGRRRTVERDFGLELQRLHVLPEDWEQHSNPGLGPHSWTFPDAESSAPAIAALRALGESLTVEWTGKAGRTLRADDPRALKVSIVPLREWLGVRGTVTAEGVPLSIESAVAALRLGRRWVRVDATTFVRIEDRLREVLQATADAAHGADGAVEISPLSAQAIVDLAAAGAKVSGSELWLERGKRIQEAAAMQPAIPKGLSAELRPYQQEGFRFLARLAHWCEGAVLADDMGLGKTVQALALLLHRAKEGPALVVAPTSVGWNWVREAQRFAPTLKVRLLRGEERSPGRPGPGDLLVTSYDLMLRDEAELQPIQWATVIFDEAQNLKNPQAQRTRVARDLQAGFRIALTGTPVENRLAELWSIFRVSVPPLLGSWERFSETHLIPVERNRDPRARKVLAALLRPFLLRRLKGEVAKELPPRTEVRVDVELSSEEKRLYARVRDAGLALLEAASGDGLSGAMAAKLRVQALAALLRMRQAACHGRLIEATAPPESTKVAVLREIVAALREEGEKALIFSQFTSLLDLVEPALSEDRVGFLRIDGSTPEPTRRRLVEAFQGGGADVFLLSLKAGGTGLNLTRATTVIHLDPWWNPAAEDQATDRAHRIGQDRPVTVYRLVARDTVEDRILKMHEEKRELADALLSGADGAKAASLEDLLDLMRAVPVLDDAPAGAEEARARPSEVVPAKDVAARVKKEKKAAPAAAAAPTTPVGKAAPTKPATPASKASPAKPAAPTKAAAPGKPATPASKASPAKPAPPAAPAAPLTASPPTPATGRAAQPPPGVFLSWTLSQMLAAFDRYNRKLVGAGVRAEKTAETYRLVLRIFLQQALPKLEEPRHSDGLWHACVADIEAKQRTPDSAPPALGTLKMRKSVLEQLIGVLRDLPGARKT